MIRKRKNAAKDRGGRKGCFLSVVLLALILLFLLAGCGSGTGKTTVVKEGEYLAIPIADISDQASFYPVEVDGTNMEVFAIMASDGTIRTAFNTCQSCYTSGKGFYKQEGADLVCNNCGFHFTADEVEVVSGGCNPWPIFDENKTVTDIEIQIPYDFLSESKTIFANWSK